MTIETETYAKAVVGLYSASLDGREMLLTYEGQKEPGPWSHGFAIRMNPDGLADLTQALSELHEWMRINGKLASE